MNVQGELTGRTLGRFHIGAQLGAGGMGVVYLADDTSLGRKVAIKVLPPHLLTDPIRRERFMREARSAAAVSHPNIATVHDIVESDGLAFIVMEYVQGWSLRAMCAQGRPPLARALELGATLADAVASAHAAGVVHRDLKPENLMLDATGRLKVLDFGIAKLDPTTSTGEGMGAVSVTREGSPIGTPGYMSPEQVRGEPVDHRTDVFSVGVILYEMITGRAPFVGNTPFDVIVATTRDEPAPISQLIPQLPPRIASVVSSCLEKDPGRRPGNMTELAAELRRLAAQATQVEQGGSPKVGAPTPDALAPTLAHATPAGPTPAPSHATPALAPTVAHPTPSHASGPGPGYAPTPGLTPFAGAATVTSTSRSSRLIPAVLALGGVALLALVLVVAGLLVVRGRGARVKRARAAATTTVVTAAAPSSEPKAGLAAIDRYVNRRDSKGQAHNTAPAWDSAAQDFERANRTGDTPIRWRSAEAFSRGQSQLLRGELEPAQKSYEEAATLEPSWALPQIGLSEVFERKKDKPRALRAAQRAQQLEPKLWLGVRHAARAYGIDREFNAAINEFRRALSLSPNNALLLAELAITYHVAEMDDEASSTAELALKQDGDLIAPHLLLAEQALEKNRSKVALKHASRVVQVDPESVSGWLAKGDALTLLGRRDEAKRAYEEALAQQKRTKAPGAPQERLDVVASALRQGTLPPPRSAAVVNPRSRPPRSGMPKPSPPRSHSPGGSLGEMKD